MKLTCVLKGSSSQPVEITVDEASTSPADLVCIACVHLGVDVSLAQTSRSAARGTYVYVAEIKGKGSLLECVGAAENLQGTVLAEGDLIVIKPADSASSSSASSSSSSLGRIASLRDLPPGLSPQNLYETLRAHPHLIRELSHHNSKLAEAAQKDDGGQALRAQMMMDQLDKSMHQHEQNEMRRRIIQNPMDPEAQAHMLQEIQQKAIMDNMAMAMEETPESFGQVLMLYVDVEVNNIKLKAFVDSGAQMTIMSESCAERCGLMRLLDRRFAGQAVGVGSAKILGKIHLAALKLGSSYFNCAITVLEDNKAEKDRGGGVDFLFGLDMLKRHQCCIDLKAKVLRLEGASGAESVPFLSENEVPEHARLSRR